MPEPTPVTPVPAATVMLVRDVPGGGVEVFLMKRGQRGAFGGLHVFPGGKVDPDDGDAGLAVSPDGPDDARASAILGVPEGGLAYWIACIRECFEEAGVLLARGEDDRFLELRDPARRRLFAGWRDRVHGGESGALHAMCVDDGLRLATDQLAYAAHWITPEDQPRRFDTRFFVARAPAHQEALHDGQETVESQWLRPEEALEAHERGELNLISPTFTNLRGLCGHADTESLLVAYRAVDPATIPTILPRIRKRGEGYEEVLEEVAGR